MFVRNHEKAPGFVEKTMKLWQNKDVILPKNYAKKLAQRAKDSHIYRDYQFTGLEIAKILNDPLHKALYIKLAKDMDGGFLLRIAKSIAPKKEIKNKGAYFMRIVQMEREQKSYQNSAKERKQELHAGE